MTWLARSLALGIGLCCAGVAAAQTPISFVHRAPLFAREGNSVVIEGQMLGASEVESVELVYKSGAEAWRNLEFELVSADHYRVEIPGGEVRPPTLEYYVVAIDFLENRHAALANETQPVQVRVEASPSAATSAAPAPAPPPKPAPKPAPKPSPERAATPPRKAAPGALPMPQAAAVDRRAATRVTIIERDTMDAMGARTLLDVLAAAPAIEVWRDVAGFDRVAVRGRAEEGDVLLVIDGLVQNSVYDGRAFWRLPAGVIEQVVIERGAASLRDGMAGLAGTVAVSTRRNQAKRVQAAAGSHLSHTRDGDARTYGSYALVASGGVDAAPAAVTAFAALDLTDGTQATVREDALSSAGLASEAPGPAQDHSLRLAGGAALSLDEIMPGSFTLAGHYLLERRGAQV
ncbi:MAG: TonB-dependent receptor plug domain-containing protein, partial [Deltaproteobacteria bacterium]|nr:TonB-dependent receptor plug domain-containing protein [Deltaproteobacteria bacterium]